MSERILVVDDEEDLCEIIQYGLEKAGFLVDVAYSAEEVMKMELNLYSLFLLDVMMGEVSGFKLGAYLKKNESTKNIPIIFITAKDTENDKLMGFSIGADDYVSKPFSINELVARVKAVLKRTTPVLKQSLLNKAMGIPEDKTKEEAELYKKVGYEKLCLNLHNKTATIDDKEIQLTKKEFELLALFLSKPDTIFSREQLLADVWKGESYVLDRTIDVNITRLRKKIVPYDKNIVTRQGYGYYFSTAGHL